MADPSEPVQTYRSTESNDANKESLTVIIPVIRKLRRRMELGENFE